MLFFCLTLGGALSIVTASVQALTPVALVRAFWDASMPVSALRARLPRRVLPGPGRGRPLHTGPCVPLRPAEAVSARCAALGSPRPAAAPPAGVGGAPRPALGEAGAIGIAHGQEA